MSRSFQVETNPTNQVVSLPTFDTLTTDINSEMPSKPFNRFILNSHQKKFRLDQKLLQEVKQTIPSKTIACQRCRRLRKRCSKHFPQCLTCIKMGEECEYADKVVTNKKKRNNSEEISEPNSSTNNNKSRKTSTSTASTPSSTTPASSNLTLLPPLTQNSLSWQYNINTNLPIDEQQQQLQLQFQHQQQQLQQENYTYQEPKHSGSRSLSIPAINTGNNGNNIRLPSISLQQQTEQSKQLQQNQQQQQQQIQQQQQQQQQIQNQNQNQIKPPKKNTEIQNAILSTLINLGKQNLTPTTNFTTSDPLMIQKEHALKYCESYFKSFYEEYPFIHKGEFYKKFDQINLFNVLNPTFGSLPLDTLKKNLQVYLILTIGFKNLHNSNGLSEFEIKSYTNIFNNQTIQNFIQQTLTFGTLDDIKIMTLLVIDSFFARNCISTTNLTNILTGAAIRSNLHRKLNKSRSDVFTRFEIEMRYRLFWSIYIIDRTVSVYLNKLVGIPDEYINLPYTIRLDDYDDIEDNICVNFKLNIELKQIEGNILREIHSVLAINNNPIEKNEIILKNLRNNIESWYLKATSNLISKPNFDNSTSLWHTTRYYNCLTLLYRHSYLIPILTTDLLDKLAKAVLQNLSYSYNLTINKSCFSLNWMSFFRILVIFKTLLKCLVSESINLYEAKTELNLCIELLKNYLNDNEDWIFIHDIIEIFQGLLKLSFIENKNHDELIEILKQSETKLTGVLKSNTIGCRLDDRIEDEYNLDERIEAEYNLKS